MIESFKGLTLEGSHMSSPSRPARKKNKLVQVLNSVEFSDYDGSSDIGRSLGGESMIDSEFSNIEALSTKGNFSDDKSWNQSYLSDVSQQISSPHIRPTSKTHTYIPSSKGIVKYEMADKDSNGQMSRFPLHQQTTIFLDNVSLEPHGT